MITPDKIIKVLIALLLLMLWPLIGGQGGYLRVLSLSDELAEIKEQNAQIFEENQRLAAEVRSLVRGADAIEERALRPQYGSSRRSAFPYSKTSARAA